MGKLFAVTENSLREETIRVIVIVRLPSFVTVIPSGLLIVLIAAEPKLREEGLALI